MKTYRTWSRTSPQQREKFLDQVERSELRQKRRRRLYNRMYRKSCLFISAWIVRSVFILLYVAVLFLHHTHGSYSKEVVVDSEVEKHVPYSFSRPPKRGVIFNIHTNQCRYSENVIQMRFTDLKRGDTLIIERNIFGRPIYFYKDSWNAAHRFSIGFRYYFVVLFATLISLAFNNGLDRFTNKLLKIIVAVNVLAILCYFFG